MSGVEKTRDWTKGVFIKLIDGRWEVKIRGDSPLTRRDYGQAKRAFEKAFRVYTRDLILKSRVVEEEA